MLIITPDYEENEADALIDNVKGIIEGGGNLIHLDVWGKRRLAYPIQKRSEGYYAVYVFECEPSFVAQVNQALRVIEAILRHMIVLYEDDIEKLKTSQEEAAASESTNVDTVIDTPESGEEASESGEEASESGEEAPESGEEAPESGVDTSESGVDTSESGEDSSDTEEDIEPAEENTAESV